MQSEWIIPTQGYVMRGHVDSLSEGREAAAKWMRGNGFTNFDAEKYTERADVEQAWWDDENGVFVQSTYEGAAAVTVVHIPV